MTSRSTPRIIQTLRFLAVFAFCAGTLVSLNCQPADTASRTDIGQPAPTYAFEIIHTYPHDPDAYTQGLIFDNGQLLESTGRNGKSSLRQVELQTGKVLQQVVVPEEYFAEGIALLGEKIYQLTWQHQLCFVYDHQTFKKLGQLSYDGEGWGLTTDGHSLILSDGTSRLRFLSPDNLNVTRTLEVLDGQEPVTELNELEYIKGQIYANVWHKQRIAIIDPKSGKVTGWLNLDGLLSPNEVADEEGVLNGIAYDEKTDRLFVTGKLWPKLFEIRVKR
ncbi:MAG TPA: glutaminyl-peptide cyclotransferase [Pyrinomonadaceae bacterium]|nr:glutaminyl-peptide cyclotransferase [Pyrinomonadaceae bacterium]